jgi:hypothetical protein
MGYQLHSTWELFLLTSRDSASREGRHHFGKRLFHSIPSGDGPPAPILRSRARSGRVLPGRSRVPERPVGRMPGVRWRPGSSLSCSYPRFARHQRSATNANALTTLRTAWSRPHRASSAAASAEPRSSSGSSRRVGRENDHQGERYHQPQQQTSNEHLHTAALRPGHQRGEEADRRERGLHDVARR